MGVGWVDNGIIIVWFRVCMFVLYIGLVLGLKYVLVVGSVVELVDFRIEGVVEMDGKFIILSNCMVGELGGDDRGLELCEDEGFYVEIWCLVVGICLLDRIGRWSWLLIKNLLMLVCEVEVFFLLSKLE